MIFLPYCWQLLLYLLWLKVPRLSLWASGKICVHSILSILHLWDFIGCIVVFVVIVLRWFSSHTVETYSTSMIFNLYYCDYSTSIHLILLWLIVLWWFSSYIIVTYNTSMIFILEVATMLELLIVHSSKIGYTTSITQVVLIQQWANGYCLS